MSVLIQRYLPRFTVLVLTLLCVGIGVQLLDLGQEGNAQGDPGAPVPLQSVDIGDVSQPGAYAALGDGAHLVTGAPTRSLSPGTGLRFAYSAWEGDGEFVVQLTDMLETGTDSMAGLMLRSGLDPDSSYAFVGYRPQGSVSFLRRQISGGPDRDDSLDGLSQASLAEGTVFLPQESQRRYQRKRAVNDAQIPRWLRLVRAGDVVVAYDSADGLTWEWLGTDRVELGEAIWVGLTVVRGPASGDVFGFFSDLTLSALSAEFLASNLLAGLVEGVQGEGDGLLARYFGDRAFQQLLHEQVDPQVAFDWGLGSPLEEGPADNFSVRWEGLLEAPYTGPYFLHLSANDSAQIWLDGQLLVDDWLEHSQRDHSALANLQAGERYHLRIDYSEARGPAAVQLEWSSPMFPRQRVPQSQLYSALSDENENQIPDEWERVFSAPGGGPFETPPGLDRAALADGYARGQHPGSPVWAARPVAGLSDWLSADLSPAGPAGRTQSTGLGNQVISSAGARYFFENGRAPRVTRDKFHYSYQEREGDWQLVVRVEDIEDAKAGALAGIMVRESLAPDSRFVAVMATPNRESYVLARTESGHRAETYPAGYGAWWLKLERRGGGIRVSESLDGTVWRFLGHEPFTVDGSYLMGLAVQGSGVTDAESVSFSSVTPSVPSAPLRTIPPMEGLGDGLKARYTGGGQSVEMVQGPIDFRWMENEPPAPGIASDRFYSVWEGELQARYTEVHTIEIACDDGARLWLDGLLFIDDWRDSLDFPRRVRLELEAGKRYPIRLEHYDARGEASARLSWASPSMVLHPIPAAQLYSTIGPVGLSFVGRGKGMPAAYSETTNEGAFSELVADSPLLFGPPDPENEAMGLRLVTSVNPTAISNAVGDWEVDQDAVVCQTRRGSVDYTFNIDLPGLYLIEVAAESVRHWAGVRDVLWFRVDGEYLGQQILMGDNVKQARQLTQWLEPGTHGLNLFWDNALPYRSLRFNRIAVQRLEGPDQNSNQVPDWMEEEIVKSNTVDSPSQSLVSPADVEGKAVYWNLVRASTNGIPLDVLPGAGDRWSVEVPLDPIQTTTVDLLFENGAHHEAHELEWRRTHLRESADLRVRQGDSLLFGFGPESAALGGSFTVDGGPVLEVPRGGAVPHRFDKAGDFTIEARAAAGAGEHSFMVSVAAPMAIKDELALKGQWRDWGPLPLSDGVVIEADPGLELRRLGNETVWGQSFRVRTHRENPSYVLFRLGHQGPILQRVAISGFRLDMGSSAGMARIIESYDDGTVLVEADLVMTPLRPEIRIKSAMATGGILFSSGDLVRETVTAGFDELGIVPQRFILGSTAARSITRNVDVYHRNLRINEF